MVRLLSDRRGFAGSLLPNGFQQGQRGQRRQLRNLQINRRQELTTQQLVRIILECFWLMDDGLPDESAISIFNSIYTARERRLRIVPLIENHSGIDADNEEWDESDQVVPT